MRCSLGIDHAERRSLTRDRRSAFTMVELLIAISVAMVALAAAWPWLWSAVSAARDTQARCDAATAAAYAARAVADDVALATGLLAPPAGVPASRSIRLEHRHPDQGLEEILIVWDPGRQVLWRKTSASYLADHVTAFSVEYLDAGGALIEPSAVSSSGWPTAVRRLRLRMTVAAGDQQSSVECDALVGPL